MLISIPSLRTFEVAPGWQRFKRRRNILELGDVSNPCISVEYNARHFLSKLSLRDMIRKNVISKPRSRVVEPLLPKPILPIFFLLLKYRLYVDSRTQWF